MTTEQMDWLDDERAGRIAQGRASTVDGIAESTPEMHTDEEWALIRDEANGIRAWGMSGIPEIMFGDPTDEQLAAAQERSGRNGVLVIPEEVRGVWETPVIQSTTPVPGVVTDTTHYDEDTLFKVQQAIRVYADLETTTDIISEMQNAGILFRERVSEAEPYWVERKGQVDEMEEHTHVTRDARDQCEAGDHHYALLLDAAAEREKIAAHDEAEGRPHLAEAIRELIDQPQGEASMIAAAGWCSPSSQIYNMWPTDEEIKMAKRERRKAKKARRREAEEKSDEFEKGMATMAEEPIENRLRRAWLNGFKDGVDRAAFATQETTGRWDY